MLGKWELCEVNLDVREGEIVGVAGVDGNGQLELESAIMGLQKHKNGTIRLNGMDITEKNVLQIRNAGIGYIPSDRYKRAILPNLSLHENYLLGFQDDKKFTSRGFVLEKKCKLFSNKLIKTYDVRCSNLNQSVGSLSGGNQQKLVLGREVDEKYNVIFASQPCRGLDIGAVQFIHQEFLRLRDMNKAVLLISADLDEIQKMSDRIAVLYKGELMAFKPASEFTTQELGLLMAGKRD